MMDLKNYAIILYNIYLREAEIKQEPNVLKQKK